MSTPPQFKDIYLNCDPTEVTPKSPKRDIRKIRAPYPGRSGV